MTDSNWSNVLLLIGLVLILWGHGGRIRALEQQLQALEKWRTSLLESGEIKYWKGEQRWKGEQC